MAVTAAGHAWTCGHNNKGQLGVGDTADRLGFTHVDAGQLGGARISKFNPLTNLFFNRPPLGHGVAAGWSPSEAPSKGDEYRIAVSRAIGDSRPGRVKICQSKGWGLLCVC